MERSGAGTRARAPRWTALEDPAAASTWTEVAAPLAARIRTRAEEGATRMLERIRAELPALVATPDEAEINRASNEANLLLIADLLEAGTDPASASLPATTRAYAEFGADRDTDLGGLLRAYRIGHAYAWELVLGELRQIAVDGETLIAAIALVSSWLHAYIDAVVCQGEEVYVEERERWLRGSAAIRNELIKSILAGSAVDRASASLRLGYELEAHHVAVIAWTDEPAGSSSEHLAATEAAVGAAATAAGCGRPLLHAIGLSATAGWLGSRETIDPATLVAPGESSVRLAVGGAGTGLDGFRRSHREAAEARRIAMLGTPRAGVTRYDDVALRALGTADPAQAERFVRAHLGPLLDPEQASARLSETLAAFLDEGASYGRAASRLGVHENTVRYRIRQVEELLGRPVRSDELELRLALALAGDVVHEQAGL